MPNGVFNWKFQDVVDILKAHNFILNHTRGSHFYYIGHAQKMYRQVCVPFHAGQTIKPRTLKGIVIQSGIPKKEWGI